MGTMVLTSSGHSAIAQAIKAGNLYLAWGDIPPFLLPPTSFLNTVVSGSIPSTGLILNYQITALNNNGETIPSSQLQVITPSSGSTTGNELSWTGVATALSYNIYLSIGSLIYLIGNSVTTSFIDTGIWLTPINSLPNVNSTSVLPWGTNPPPIISPFTSSLYRELGRRLVVTCEYVYPDSNGTIQTTGGNWTVSLAPTSNLYVQVTYALTDADTSIIYQFGLYTNTIPLPAYDSTYYLTPSMISNFGSLLCAENTSPIIRNPATTEIHAIVLTF